MNDHAGTGLLDLFDRLVAEAAAWLPPEAVASLAAIARQTRKRRTFPDSLFVVGLVGGTGSGKSSLLNALAEEEVSPAGALRPTTSRALAWLPSHSTPGVEAALALMGVKETVEHDLDPALVVIDLPDTDSMASGHRRQVEGLVPYLDLVIWVLDPEKYRDRVMHENWLRPLAIHQHMFRFVLNQIDRLPTNEVGLLVADLEQVLRADGMVSPVVWAVAADPVAGPPVGIDQVWEGLGAARASGSGRGREMARELKRGADLLAAHLKPVDFNPRWAEVRRQVTGLLRSRDPVAASRQLEQFVAEMAPRGGIDAAKALAEAAATSDPSRTLDLGLGRQLRDLLRPRARTRALLVELQLELARLEQGMSNGG